MGQAHRFQQRPVDGHDAARRHRQGEADLLFQCVKGAIQGGSAEAREAWKRDLAERKRYTREQRERRRADRRS
ncbi:hypothetical protein [Micromonospora parastrephiae]|uniref:hypothetical protein n=1 Tax=Micromonospora parastrephiae TaxID=2806101 RepID=UPI001EE4C24A|nr:hypothetical protein [Micromonospora parastrephiae]